MQAGLIKASSESGYICGRIQNDRFAVCMPKDSFKNEIMQNSIVSMQDRFNNASFKIRVVVGVYDIEDVDEPVSNMCDKAFIASETIKNNYEANIAYYDDKLLKRTLEERRVIGEFEGALERKNLKCFFSHRLILMVRFMEQRRLCAGSILIEGYCRHSSSLIFWRRQVLYISLICICGNVQQLN